MKRTKFIIATILVACSLQLWTTYAQIPDIYKPNAAIQEKYDKIINEIFVEIQSKTQIGQPIATSVFAELYTLFDDIIPHLPNTYSFNIIYQQCLSLSQTLSTTYNLNTLANFMDNCYKPFIRTVENINKDYTINANWTIAPVTWPAPLSVTLDARASTDPSNQTIPSDNFFRYYRDTAGVDRTIGRWNVLNYTFNEAGNYTVHLTVRSSNHTSQWVVDGSRIFSVDVAPRAANIVAFANGQRLSTTERIKFWLQEGQRGIVLDWSATTARGWRILTSHRRDVQWPNGFSATRQGQWVPWTLRSIFPDQWEYRITLTVFDNQNNQLAETFSVAISDPVAIIKQNPEVGNTSVEFTFDGSTSYSITSRLRLFTREIIDGQGNRIDTYQWKSIRRKFARPGNYTVNLTVVDEQWQENRETKQILVESTPPVAQFLSTPSPELLYPSEFLLNASVSSDIDVDNGFDELSYDRSFSDPTTEIIESINNGERVRLQFNQIWQHTVTLTVTDQYGKTSTIAKNFNIQSTLRPQILANPTTTSRGSQTTFVVQTNKNVLWYERDFGDGNKRVIQERNTTHVYQQVWVYTVKLKVRNGQEENEVTKQVFIGEKDSPIPWYVVENPSINLTMIQNDVCIDEVDWEQKEVPAYRMDRYKEVKINANESVNVWWEKRWLRMFFQPRNDQIFRSQWWNFTYRFNELWCHFVDLTVEDEVVGKRSSVKIWFNIVNALPTIDNLILTFPQFWNSYGIGFQQAGATPQDIFITDFDPLIVRVSATNARDMDWNIAYFQRYYYEKDNPSRILATKISPGDMPTTFFSVPKTPGEFMFGVRIFDNDGWSQRSESIIGNWPVVFFPPDTNRPDIPMVVLRVDKTAVDIGEEITFDIIGRVLSDRPDFEQERVIQIDFDGDGEWDITTKSDRVTYAYTKPSESWFTPRASIVYRGYRWVAQWENIIVRNALRPRLLFNSSDTLMLVRDVSLWDITTQTICMDARFCNDNTYTRTEQDLWFTFNYPEIGRYVVNMEVFDQNANNATQRRPITLEENNDTLDIVSIPAADTINEIPEIFVGKNLDNAVLFYIKYNNPNGVCYVDANISRDSTNEWNPEQNKDFLCNQIHLEEYGSQYQSITWRVYYEEEGNLKTQDFLVSFLDFELELDEKTLQIIKRVDTILETIDRDVPANQYLIDQLIALKESVLDKNDVRAIVVSIDNTLNNQELVLSENEQTNIANIINSFEDRAVTAALWGTEYEQAKWEILSILPPQLRSEIQTLFDAFENIVGTAERTVQEKQKDALQEIVVKIGQSTAEDSSNIQADQIDSADMEMIVIPNICIITELYNIPTENCDYGDKESSMVTTIPDQVNDQISGSWWLAWWIKILLIILGVLVFGFIGLVVLFAFKAKMREKEGDQEDEDEYIVPQDVVQPPVNETNNQPDEQENAQSEEVSKQPDQQETSQDETQQTQEEPENTNQTNQEDQNNKEQQ